ncbi:hypothetical protein SPRG_07202 [Saprolegnia parasitica CBS 223.65]|uniref:Uncharacterized protein n=1 Tax=Saprolegnia parasitica (strain CBS 223.65) TaxID=695850 RepID=A0A067CBP3_SAPPC|nr:hypothetical protein SPRG_07202 [Saprolegnia parasitica CBS 223.65]KDO27928.1 hypothetical protein SPRG_07202 [Saprolegnia parasitica CBS 223.65]|eukprot:XP_012201384.1 hypothetical protein SPRG_07202 [Saprolegnia parasitica CBS 223.65]
MAALEKDAASAVALASAKATAAAQETELCNRITALESRLINASASKTLDEDAIDAIDVTKQGLAIETVELETHEMALHALQIKVDAADAKASALTSQLAALTARAVDAEAKAVFLSAELAAAVARSMDAEALVRAAKAQHEAVQVMSEREIQEKTIAHLEAQLARAEAKIDELKRATANTTQVHRLASERFTSNIDGFLERVLHDYDSRLIRCSAKVDVLQSLQDTHAAQFRDASSLVGHMQEERLAQYEILSSLYDQVTTPTLCLLDVSPNGQYLQTMLFQRLRQLHEHMADQAGDDEKKLNYAKLLVATMHARQVEFVETCISLYRQTS